MNELWSLLADSFWQILLPGLTMTIPLTVISFSLALVIAIAVALVQFAKIPVLKELCRFYIWVIRGTPLLVQLFVVFYGLPHMGVLIEAFPAAVIVFSINEGAYCAETVRAALESVPARAAGGGRVRGPLLGPVYPAHRIAPGAANRIPISGQFADRHGEGYVSGGKYHGDRDVYGHPADRGPDL